MTSGPGIDKSFDKNSATGKCGNNRRVKNGGSENFTSA